MRALGKDEGGQIYGKSHPDITAILKHDAITFRRERWIFGRGPDGGQMLSALVLAYGSLGLERRKQLMEVLIRNLQTWLDEGPALEGDELARSIAEILMPPGPGTVVGGHTVGRPAPKRPRDT